MGHRWTRRRGHNRRLRSGRLTYVRDSWVLRRLSEKRHQRYRHPCPHCGAEIISIHMPNRGWAHFEGKRGLTRVKHACMHPGEGLSRARDSETLDLFEEMAGN